MKSQSQTHDTPHPTFDRLRFLTRRIEQIRAASNIKGDDSFFSAEQDYINAERLTNLYEEKVSILTLCN